MKHRSLRFAALVVLLSACSWTMAGHGPDRRGWSRFDTAITPANAATLTPGWTASGLAGYTETIGNNDLVFARGPDEVRALARTSGAEKWRASYQGTSIPALTGDVLTVSTGGGHCAVTQVRAADNAPIRSVAMGGPDVTGTIGGGVSSCAARSVFADEHRIIVAWHYVGFSPAPHCPLAWEIADGITAFLPDLSAPWETQTTQGGCGPPPVPLPLTSPYSGATRAGDVYLFNYAGSISAMPVACGTVCTPRWQIPINGAWVMGLSDTRAAAVDVTGHLTVFDVATGATVWTGSVGATTEVGMAATDTSIFVPTIDGTLYAFAVGGCGAPTCSPAWTASIGSVPRSRPSIAGNVVYVSGNDTKLKMFAASGCGTATCTSVGTVTATAVIVGAPTIINGRVFVNTLDYTLETFALPAP